MASDRFSEIDDSNRSQHSYLETDDLCLYYREYFAGKGFEGTTNQLIHNFKIEPSAIRANPVRARYKSTAINTIALQLRQLIDRHSIETSTWVPIPPSKTAGDPDYDDRLLTTLRLAFAGYNADIRPLLLQSASTTANHKAGVRLSPEELYELLDVDNNLLASQPLRHRVVLFDDVLTSGNHYKCCERRLREHIPARMSIVGVFIARRVPANPFDGIEL